LSITFSCHFLLVWWFGHNRPTLYPFFGTLQINSSKSKSLRFASLFPSCALSFDFRINKKMHNGSMIEILYTFVSEAKAMTR